MNTTTNLKTASIADLVRIAYQDWPQKSYTAAPYMEAMVDLRNIDDVHGADTGRNIVTYFLSNATGWKGETAKAVKAELKRRLKIKPGEIPLDEDLIKKVAPVSRQVWNQIAYDVCEAIKAEADGKKPKPIKNIEAIEASLDANYPTMFCGAEGKAVDELMDKVFKFHGPDKVLRFLNKNITLDTGVY